MNQPARVFRIGLAADSPSPQSPLLDEPELLSDRYDRVRTHQTAEGVWFHGYSYLGSGGMEFWGANDFYFLTADMTVVEPVCTEDLLLNADVQSVGSVLVTASLDDGGVLCCHVVDRRAGVVPVPVASSVGAETSFPKILPGPDGSGFWLTSPGNPIYYIDPDAAVDSHHAGIPFSPARFEGFEPTHVRPVGPATAIGYGSHGNRRGVFRLNGMNESVELIRSLRELDIIDFYILDENRYLAKVSRDGGGGNATVYVHSDEDETAFGGPDSLPIHIRHFYPPFGPYDLHNRMFLSADDHSFIAVEGGAVFLIETETDPSGILLSRRDRAVGLRPPLVPDRDVRLWLINSGSGSLLRGVSVWDREQAEVVNSDRPLLGREPDVPTIVPFGDGRHALGYSEYVNDREDDLFFIDMKATPPAPDLKLGGSNLVADPGPDGPLAFDPHSDPVRLTFGMESLPGRLGDQATIQVVLTDKAGHYQRKWVTQPLTADVDEYEVGRAAAASEQDREPYNNYGSQCTVEATLSDSLGTAVTWTWDNVVFREPIPLLDRHWFRSVLAFVFICALVWVGKCFPGGPQTIARVGVYVASTASMASPWVGKDLLDPTVLVGLLVASFLLGAVTGLLSPRMFRELESLEPFRYCARVAATIPGVRRRLFAGYVTRLLDRLEREREKANGETYIPLPFTVGDAHNTEMAPDADSPADQLCKAVSAREADERTNLIIEAPGGRGKSALLREVVRLAVVEFSADPRRPIPVFCDGDGDTLFDRAAESLGRDGFSSELLRSLAKSGAFFFVLDGLSESTVTANTLRQHVAAYDISASMLLSTRPSDAHLRAVEQAASAWVVVEPERLSDDTLDDFVQGYTDSAGVLSPEVKDACRDEDGTYLPILIRLAILADGQGMRSIRDVYSASINQILSERALSADSAVQLCRDTYWATGDRRLRFANATHERRAVLRDLMGADLVVPAETNRADADNPHTVRFFHDSIQSYLTAVGLTGEPQWRDELLEAAGHPRFDADSTGVTELFRMCFHTFDSQPTLRKHLLDSLLGFSTDFAGALNRDWVVRAANLPDLADSLPPDMAGGLALAQAARECFENSDIRYLGSLYARVARHIWPKVAPQPPVDESGS